MFNNSDTGKPITGIPMWCAGCGANFGSLDGHRCPPESLKIWEDILERGASETEIRGEILLNKLKTKEPLA